jgi:hypothetical protein
MTNPACFDDQYHVFLMSGGHNHKPVEMTGNTGTGKSKIKNEGRISVEQYNQELEEAEAEIDRPESSPTKN